MMAFVLAGGLTTQYHRVNWSASVEIPVVFTIVSISYTCVQYTCQGRSQLI